MGEPARIRGRRCNVSGGGVSSYSTMRYIFTPTPHHHRSRRHRESWVCRRSHAKADRPSMVSCAAPRAESVMWPVRRLGRRLSGSSQPSSCACVPSSSFPSSCYNPETSSPFLGDAEVESCSGVGHGGRPKCQSRRYAQSVAREIRARQALAEVCIVATRPIVKKAVKPETTAALLVAAQVLVKKPTFWFGRASCLSSSLSYVFPHSV
ncbi:hypothetical protein DFH06DRAFT_1174989 [Mycena polygramma]|nr:hypothetical protein DFH06DRAFT_1174989 [Mycena polygramma]